MHDDFTRDHLPDQNDEAAVDEGPTQPQRAAPKMPVPPRKHVGELLREFRETYVWRLAREERAFRVDGVSPLTIRELVEMLKSEEYSISETEYFAIEAGRAMPRELEPFVDAIAECLNLNGELLRLLIIQLSCDLLLAQFDPSILHLVFPHSAD